MRPGGPRRGRAAAALGGALGAALLLGGCAPTAAARPHLTGVPARSISVPLSVVGCAADDVCVALGSSVTAGAPSSVAEFSTPRSPWLALHLPSAASPSIVAIGCASTACLIGGGRPGGDLLWSFDAPAHRVTALDPPAGGGGVEAVACAGSGCALVDASGTGGSPRWSTSADGGATWSAPSPLVWADGDVVTSIACASAGHCVVAARSARGATLAAATDDAGLSWSAVATPARWVALTSLSCTGTTCVGLARTVDASLLVRLSASGRWRSTPLDGPVTALACTAARACVGTGGARGRAFLELVSGTAQHAGALRYVPTPLVGVACGAGRCAAIGDTTLVDVPSSLVRSYAPPAATGPARGKMGA